MRPRSSAARTLGALTPNNKSESENVASDNDVISLKVLVDAARAVNDLKRAQSAAQSLAAEFEKLSEAERKAIIETARMQQAAAAAAAEERRTAGYMAEAARMRREETSAFEQATRAATAETRKLSQESERLAASSLSLGEKIRSTADFTEALRKKNDDAAESLRSSTSVVGILTTNLSDLGGKLRAVSPLWGTIATNAVGSFARISIGVGVAVAGISALTMGLGRLAADSERTERAERILGASMDAVRATTLDTVTAQQALALQQGLVQSGLRVSAEQLGVIAGKAREFALATGGETPEALNQMLDALRGLEAEGLRRFGVTLNATGDRQRDFNTAVEALTNRERLAAEQAHKWGNSLEAVANQQQRVSTSARTMGEDADRASTSFSRMTSNIAASFARAMDLNGVFQFWAETFDPTTNQRRIASNSARMRADERSRERSNTMGALGRLRSAGYNVSTLTQYAQSEGADLGELARIRGAAGVAGDLAERGAGGAQVAAAMRGLGALPGVQSMLRTQTREDSSREMAVDSERKIRKASDQISQAGDSAERFAERLQKAKEIAVGSIVDIVSLAAGVAGGSGFRNRFQTAGSALGLSGLSDTESADLFGGIADAQQGGGAMAREARARAQRIADRNRGTLRMAREQSLGGRVMSGLGMRTGDDGRIAGFDAMTEGATMLTGVVGTLQSGLSSLFDTLVSGSADAGTAFQAFASSLLTELGKMAFNKGLFYTFEGIAALFSAPPAAPAYFAAGAGLIALGAGLGAAGAATKPQAPAPGASTDTARGLAPRSSAAIGAGSRDLAPVNVTLSSLVPAGPSDAQRLRSGLRDARRRGFADGNVIPRRVEH
jgi:hypothetical protein